MIEISRKKLTLILEALESAFDECRDEPGTEWTEFDYRLADAIADIKETLGMQNGRKR